MTLKQTIRKIHTLQHLIGQNVPKWESPILEIIPAPINDKFTDYVRTYQKTGNVEKAILKTRSDQFDLLLIFSKPQPDLSLVYQWYSFFYVDQKVVPEKKEPLTRDIPLNLQQQRTALLDAYTLMQKQVQLIESFLEKDKNQLPAA